MPGYVRKVETTVDFDGQQLRVVLKPLLYADLLVLHKDTQAEVLRQYQEVLPRYLESMSPVLDAAGEVVPLEEITSTAYFAPLVARILRLHVDAAQAATTNPPSAGQSEG